MDARFVYKGLRSLGYEEVPLTALQSVKAGALPPIHKDPFHRILIAQADTEDLKLLTADATVARYPGWIVKV